MPHAVAAAHLAVAARLGAVSGGTSQLRHKIRRTSPKGKSFLYGEDHSLNRGVQKMLMAIIKGDRSSDSVFR